MTKENPFDRTQIVAISDEMNVWFRGFCLKVPEREGERTPIFSVERKDGAVFLDCDLAWEVRNFIKELYPEMDIYLITAD